MNRRWRRALGVVAVVAAAAGSVTSGAAVAAPTPPPPTFTFAVIGDIPYGPAMIARFPRDVDQINADPAVQMVDHLGDIKDGSSLCDDATFARVRAQFDRFQDPLVYTVGDNEWTDCHRANNGAFNPLERLAAVRRTFFPRPALTLGQRPTFVVPNSREFVENVSFSRPGAVFGALHLVGSNNDLAPWSGLGNTTPTPEQVAEERRRTDNVLVLIDRVFLQAALTRQRAVVLLQQADMFDPTVPNPQFSDYSAFQRVVRRISERATQFRGPVYLFNGDSHVYNADRPLAPGSPWLGFYGVKPAPNLQRVTVDGSAQANNYLRVTLQPQAAEPVTWEKVPFAP